MTPRQPALPVEPSRGRAQPRPRRPAPRQPSRRAGAAGEATQPPTGSASDRTAPGSGPETGLLTIGQAARELDISVRSLRYYEEMGLLTPAARTAGGNRLYGPDDLVRVRRIRELQQLLGFNLDEVREILRYEDQIVEICADLKSASDDEDRARLLDDARMACLWLRDQVDGKIGSLVSFREQIEAWLVRNERLREGVPPADRT